MLSSDLQLSYDVTSKTKGKYKNAKDDESAGFHFIAFVPIDGQIWKLDGLERQPQKVCSIDDDDWICQIKPQIKARMAEYEEGQIEFSILSLVKAPLAGLVLDLAQNVKSLIALLHPERTFENSSNLAINPAHVEFRSGSDLPICMPDPAFGLTQDMIDRAILPPGIQTAIQSRDLSVITQLWHDLTIAQASLKASIGEEQLSKQSDQERAESRRWDYGPAVHNLVCFLARKRFFKPSNTRKNLYH